MRLYESNNSEWWTSEHNVCSWNDVGCNPEKTTVISLDLSNHGFSTLPAGIFSGLSSLQSLNLTGNYIRTLPAGIFTELTSLQSLKLGHNQLTNLSADVFTGLISLQLLGLDHNQLSTLDPHLFDGMIQLKRLWLAPNPGSDFFKVSTQTCAHSGFTIDLPSACE